jgi:uncharacterized RDD family membrane protein YckC
MSDTPQGPGWWQASDGRWYPPEQAPGATPSAAPSGGAARGPAPGPLGPGWWQASDGQWYAPEQATGGHGSSAGAPAVTQGPADQPQGPGWWQASDGRWYAPEQAPGAGWQAGAPNAGGYAMPPAFGIQPSPAGLWRAPTGDLVPLASWGRRFLAYLIDWGLTVGALIAFVLVGLLAGVIADALEVIILVIGYIVTAGAGIYFAVLNGTRGQSPGKALIGLKVVDSRTGQLIGGGMGFVRGIAGIINSLACYIGWFWPLWDDQRQTFADKIISTVVLDHQPTQDFGPDLLKP